MKFGNADFQMNASVTAKAFWPIGSTLGRILLGVVWRRRPRIIRTARFIFASRRKAQGLKPRDRCVRPARLKSCPDTKLRSHNKPDTKHRSRDRGVVSGHEFTRAAPSPKITWGFSPCRPVPSAMRYNPPQMAIPSRNANPDDISSSNRTFFVNSRTHGGRGLLQTERMTTLFIDVLRSYHRKSVFTIHDFVVMPNHFHLLITVDHNLSVEKAVQLVKGNFSFRAKRELGIDHEIWHRGFSEERVRDRESFLAHRKYIGENPIRR